MCFGLGLGLGLKFNPTNQPTTDDGDNGDNDGRGQTGTNGGNGDRRNDGRRLMDGLYLYTPYLDAL